MKKVFLAFIALLPQLVSAQTVLQDSINNLIIFTSDVIIPFLLGLAFLFFIINAIRFFVIESPDQEGREKAKALAFWGIAAFVMLVVFWGLVNLLVDATGFGAAAYTPQQNDYILRHAP